MKLTYDPRYNVAYLRFHDRPAQVDTIQVSEELNVDIAPDGTVYGIELLNANEQLCGPEGARLVVVNEARAQTAEVPLELSTLEGTLREEPPKDYGKE